MAAKFTDCLQQSSVKSQVMCTTILAFFCKSQRQMTAAAVKILLIDQCIDLGALNRRILDNASNDANAAAAVTGTSNAQASSTLKSVNFDTIPSFAILPLRAQTYLWNDVFNHGLWNVVLQ